MESGTHKVLDFYGYEKNVDPYDNSRWEVCTIMGMPGGSLQLVADTVASGPIATVSVSGSTACGLINSLSNEWHSWGDFVGRLKDSEIRCFSESDGFEPTSLTLSLEYRPDE